MQEITVVAKNEVGTLAQIAQALGHGGVNIEAISAYERNDRAVFRIVTNDARTTLRTLSRLPQLECSASDIIIMSLANRPGELAKVTRRLAERNINLESLYILSRHNDRTEVAIRPVAAEFARAREVLGIK